MSISCCAAEASEDVTRSIRTLAGCQHRRRLILTLSRQPQDYNTHMKITPSIYTGFSLTPSVMSERASFITAMK